MQRHDDGDQLLRYMCRLRLMNDEACYFIEPVCQQVTRIGHRTHLQVYMYICKLSRLTSELGSRALHLHVPYMLNVCIYHVFGE